MATGADYEITFSLDGRRPTPAWVRPMKRAIGATLGRFGASAASIHVELIDDSAMHQLNERFLQHAWPTDVLAFDLSDGTPSDPGGFVIEGDIVISLQTAEREALQRGHSLSAELALYAVHATLHLLGLEDNTRSRAARMHRIEERILHDLGLELSLVQHGPRRRTLSTKHSTKRIAAGSTGS